MRLGLSSVRLARLTQPETARVRAVRSAADIIGQPRALTPLVVACLTVILVPLAAPITASLGMTSWRQLQYWIAVLTSALVQAALAAGAQRLGRGRLRGDYLSAAIVIAAWFAIVIAGLMTYYAMLRATSNVSAPYSPGWGWIVSWSSYHIMCGAAFSGLAVVRLRSADVARVTAQARARLHKARAQTRSLRLLLADDVRQVLVPAIQDFAARIPLASAPAAAIQAWSRELMAFATGVMRDQGHALSRLDLTSSWGTDELPRADEARSRPRREVLTARYVWRNFCLVRPVTMVPTIVVLPLVLDEFTRGRRDALGAAVVLIIVEVLMIWAFMAFTGTGWYRRRQPPLQWLLWVVGLAACGMAVTPLGAILGTPDVLYLGAFYDRLQQGLALAYTLILLNFAMGLASIELSRRNVSTALTASERAADADEADAAESVNRQLIDESVSRLHSVVQGRIVALSLLLSDAAGSGRDVEPVRERVKLALDQMITSELPAVPVWSPPPPSRSGSLREGAIGEVLAAWESVLSLRATVNEPPPGTDVPLMLTVGASRVVAEAICNSVRHGNARKCDVEISPGATHAGQLSSLIISVRDDGTAAIDPEAVAAAGKTSLGLGLIDDWCAGHWSLVAMDSGTVLHAEVSVPH